jgi:type II secretory pathway pseudopilin PulG
MKNSADLRLIKTLVRRPSPSGFSIVEVLVAVLIATSALALLIPALSSQLLVSREAGRLTAVEAIVSRDLYWFSNYARFWKLRQGIYSLSPTITKTISYNNAGLAEYDPPYNICLAGSLASAMVADGQTLFGLSIAQQAQNPGLLPPYSPVQSLAIPVNVAGFPNDLTLNRKLYPSGNRLLVVYSLSGAGATGLRFSRAASILIEAAAWCDSLP